MFLYLWDLQLVIRQIISLYHTDIWLWIFGDPRFRISLVTFRGSIDHQWWRKCCNYKFQCRRNYQSRCEGGTATEVGAETRLEIGAGVGAGAATETGVKSIRPQEQVPLPE